MLLLLKNIYLSKYSFTYHPIKKLHETVPEILPGIEKMVTIHYDPESKILKGILTEKKNNEYTTQPLQIDTILPSIQRYMEDNNPFDWYRKSSLPFEIEVQRMNPEINIFSEFENIVLLIRIPDEINEFNDLVFLYLNENPSNFGITNSINPLTTDNKAIIGFLMRNMILNAASLQRTDKVSLRRGNKQMRNIIDKAENMRLEMNQTNDNYGLSLVKLCQQYLLKHSKEQYREYTLSASALDKIKSYKGDIKDMELIVSETVTFIENLNFDEVGDVEILEWHLQFDVSENTIAQEKPTIQFEKYSKIMGYLDRFENAALIVKANHLKLTGTNVGKYCQVSISAPAISELIHKHEKGINKLLMLYPEKWSTIRNDFRPLKNVMVNK